MLRLETETGWWLVTHPDHARLAGAFAERWGNERFLPPEPRAHVLKGIARHDDGWTARDAEPQITRQGKPSAFSVELVGKYSAFEEIDLADYLAVRERAVHLIAEEDAYAAKLISMHTYSLLTDHADRSTIAPAELPLLDQFLDRQKAFQESLMQRIGVDSRFTTGQQTEAAILDHLLHPLPLRAGGYSRVEVKSVGSRHFVLDPYPFSEPSLTFDFPARHVAGKVFSSAGELQKRFNAAPVEILSVTVSAA
jgi:hypothetical protein